jgi:hypothetical protein
MYDYCAMIKIQRNIWIIYVSKHTARCFADIHSILLTKINCLVSSCMINTDKKQTHSWKRFSLFLLFTNGFIAIDYWLRFIVDFQNAPRQNVDFQNITITKNIPQPNRFYPNLL